MISKRFEHHPVLRPPADAFKWKVGACLDDRAFTLVEMIVVTTLISIMLVVAVPRLGSGLFSDGSDETARWIIANVRHLKEKAVTDRKVYLLNVSPDIQRLWVTEAGVSDAEADAAREQGFALPRGINIDHVAFSTTESLSSGTIPIAFYPHGYSDKAVIRIRTRDGERQAFIIEPFLAGVKLIKGSDAW